MLNCLKAVRVEASDEKPDFQVAPRNRSPDEIKKQLKTGGVYEWKRIFLGDEGRKSLISDTDDLVSTRSRSAQVGRSERSRRNGWLDYNRGIIPVDDTLPLPSDNCEWPPFMPGGAADQSRG